MHGIAGGTGLFFRFLLAGITSMLVMSTMSLAIGFATGAAAAGPGTGDLTGSFIQPVPAGLSSLYTLLQLVVGVITFLGSFYVLSMK